MVKKNMCKYYNNRPTLENQRMVTQYLKDGLTVSEIMHYYNISERKFHLIKKHIRDCYPKIQEKIEVKAYNE